MDPGAIAVFAVVAYFLPSIVAQSRGHQSKLAIFVLNLLLGWTVIAWIACLVWSCTGLAGKERDIQRQLAEKQLEWLASQKRT